MPTDLCSAIPMPDPPQGAPQACIDEYEARWEIDDAAFAHLCGECDNSNDPTACKREKRDRRLEWGVDAIRRMGECVGNSETWVDTAIAAIMAEA